MKWKLLKHLTQKALMHKGEFMPCASDVALMLPLMEMAGLERCRHIHKLIYLWRDSTSHKTNRKQQIKYEKIVRKKAKMRRLEI